MKIGITHSIIIGLLFTAINVTDPLCEENHNHNQSPAHIHGEAESKIIMANSVFEIEFLSPAYNLMGFEHRAENEDELAIVKKTISKLRKPLKLFAFEEAECDAIKISVDSGLIIDDGHNHGEHQHEHHEADVLDKNTHLDFKVNYAFSCNGGSFPSSIDFGFFEFFKNLVKIKVQWVSEDGQGSKVLTNLNRVIEF